MRREAVFLFCSIMGRKASVSLLDSDGLFCPEVLQWAEQTPGTILLESNLSDAANRTSYLFSQPLKIITADTPEGVERSLEMIGKAVNDGCYAAGCVSYEAGYAFEQRFREVKTPHTPLLWFGIFDEPVTINRRTHTMAGSPEDIRRLRESVRVFRKGNNPHAHPLHFRSSFSEARYLDAFAKIQKYIEEGDTYQVNLTFRLFSPFSSAAHEVYMRMRGAQRVSYGAFVNAGSFVLLSCSPELFFRRAGDHITLKPMKGTAARGRTLAEDKKQAEMLSESEKNRAENRMIVDLLRNDVGKIAVPGSVLVKRFFDVEKYETVFQATSTIEATLRHGVDIPELFRSLFPSGSVTGAPKIRTMEIIRELESGPRGFYTGSIGFFAPKKKAVFNVAIRTLVIDKETETAEFGVGSGIIHDSRGTEEYKECILKAHFFETEQTNVALIETMRWDPKNRWFLLPRHLRRLRDSASYFGFRFPAAAVRDELRRMERALLRIPGKGQWRVRLILDRQGQIGLSRSRLKMLKGTQFVRFSSAATDPENRFLFHKTTNRILYDTELALAEKEGYFDILFQNKRGEITEGARSNVLIRRGDTLLTPPLECGLLPGTYRAYLLSSRHYRIQEHRLYPDDLLTADELFVCNALRGLMKVSIPEHAMTA